ncbi:MAG TPA: hypothetical protein PKD53_09105 [Chloroflexaceae bacterium]|nr:hypothetical protein [Chloroflexaceae bacterium]
MYPPANSASVTRAGLAPAAGAAPRMALAAGELTVLRWLVPLALLHGLLYLVLLPPWQHYDETAHFLYAAEVAAGELEAPGPASVALRREIAASMYRFRFYPPGFRPDLVSPQPPEVGINQRVHPPLYYALVALPLRPLGALSVEVQLYAARAVSLALYALTIVAAWRVAVALAPDEPAVQWAIPLLVLLAPAFADIMAAVNNDVLLNFSLTVALLGAVLLVRDGPRPLPLALAGLGLLVAVLTKRTALVATIPLALALFWALYRRPMRWWTLPLIALGAAAGLGLAILEPAVATGPSGDHVVLAVRPWFADLSQRYLRVSLDELVRSLSDPTLVGDRYRALVAVAFAGYYGHFAWGGLAVHPAWTAALAALALVATGGLLAGRVGARDRLPLWQRRALWVFLAAVVVAWVSIFIRLHPLPPLNQPVYIPRGRYMFWTMVPTLWLLALGLAWAAPGRWRPYAPAALVIFFVCLDLAALLWTVVGHYYR